MHSNESDDLIYFITLNKTRPGQSFMVPANAVNIVGVEAIASATCTLTKGLIIMNMK